MTHRSRYAARGESKQRSDGERVGQGGAILGPGKRVNVCKSVGSSFLTTALVAR
jgi:hypothetical protein